jgi:hypothetical protein
LINSIDNLLFTYFQGFYSNSKQLLETSLEDLYNKLERYLVVIRREVNTHTDARVNRAVRDINGHLDDQINTLKTDINSHIDDSVASATTSINNKTNNKIANVESKVDTANTLLGSIDELLTALSIEIGIMGEAIATNFFTLLVSIVELNTALGLLGVDINALQTQVTNLKNQLPSIIDKAVKKYFEKLPETT